MLVYAKSALQKEQLDCKMNIGCDGLEIQLLAELVDGKLGQYFMANDVFNLEEYKGYPISVVHVPLLSHYGLSDVNIESFVDSDFKMLDQVFYIANYFGEVQDKDIIVVIHSESDRESMMLVSDTWKCALNSVGCLLLKYPRVQIAIENVTPLRKVYSGDLHLCSNFHYDKVDMAKEFRKQLKTDRVGTCLDVCHALISEKYMTAIYKELGDAPCEDYSLESYFEQNKDTIKLIHLADMKGSGFGKGKHGTMFCEENKDKLRDIMSIYRKYEYSCPITLEVEENDFLVSDMYAITRKTLYQVLSEQ